MEIIPAILPKTYEEIENHIEKIIGIAPVVQIDICDGVFVSNTTWPYRDGTDPSWQGILSEGEGMPFWDKVDFELDLMVSHVPERLPDLMKIGPSRLIFHIESLENPNSFFDHLDPYIYESVEVGVAINPETPIDELYDLIEKDKVKFVQCMGISKIGFQGQPFDERVYDQIKALRSRYKDLPISVDGGVNLERAPMLRDAGATRLVSGNALYMSDEIRETYNFLSSL